MSHPPPWTRCLVLAPSDFDPEPVIAALAARDWKSVVSHDPHDAMAELCIRRRAQVTRSAWGLPSHENAACVVLEPGAWSDLSDFLEAIGKYAPETQLLSYASGELTTLHPARPEPVIDTSMARQILDRRSAAPVAPTTTPRPAPVVPSLRLVDSDLDASESPEPEQSEMRDPDPDDESHGITPEEIEMLLASPPGSEGHA